MKVVKKIAIGLLILLIVVIGAAAALPFIFKDKLHKVAIEEINKTINAKVDFGAVSLTLFRSFPNFSFSLRDFSVTGIDDFEGIPLASGESVDFAVDLLSILSGGNPVRIQSVHLEKPKINILVLEDGRANYDIAKPSEAPEPEAEAPPTNVEVKLKKYSIAGADIVYDDRSGGTYVNIEQLNHEGSGNFSLDVMDLETHTDMASFTVQQGAIPYLKKAKTRLDADFLIDQINSKYTLKDNKFIINEFELSADGFVQMLEEDINMDLSFSTPQNDFKQLWSLIPNAYIQGYENVKADGKFEFSGQAKGTYNGEKEQYPAFDIHIGVDNANVKYPDLPLGITNIQALVDIKSPTSSFDDMTINAPRFNLRIGKNPIKARFTLETPISDPDVDADVEGVLNLAELMQAFPMEGFEQLSGIISADITAQTRLSYIEQQDYERVNMAGDMTISQLKYKSSGMPAVLIRNAAMNFTPKHVGIEQFDAQLGKSDLQASGVIDNILAYFSPKKTMTGNLRVRSRYFDANEWLTSTEPAATPAPATSAIPGTESAEGEAAAERPFDRFDFTLDGEAGEIVYEDYHIKKAALKGNVKPNRMEMQNLSALIGDSDIKASGTIVNAFDYLYGDAVLGGDINLSSRLLNLNQFMTSETAASSSSGKSTSQAPAGTEGLEPIVVPANIDMSINADIDKLIYTNMELLDLKGRLLVKDQAVVLDETTAKTLGGTIGLAGSYDSKEKDNPAFSMKFDLNKMNFQKAFNTFNSFQKLAPIGKFIEGVFTTSLIMDGKLGKDLMPQYNTLNAEGFLQTINGVVKGFKPLQAVGNALNVDYLKNNLKLENTKNWFEVKDGALELKDFDYKVKDIAMTIGGKHSFSQDMDYKIKTRIPRKLLESNAVGAAAGSGVNALLSEASKLGINIKQSEFVNVMVNLTGTIANPKVKLKLLGGEGEETSVVEAAKDEAKQQLQQKLNEGKAKAQETATKAVDSAKTVVKKEVDKAAEDLTKKAKEAAKDKIGGVLDSTTQKKVDKVLEGAGKEGTDKIKENLDKFNPFKKKKDKDGNK